MLAGPAWSATIGVPSRAQVQYRLGMILEKSGRVADARSAYQQAIASDPALKSAREALEKLKG